MTDLAEFVTSLPKAELHLHIEGPFEPDLMFTIAARNGVSPPCTSANENCVAVGEALDLVREERVRPARNSFEASFLDAPAGTSPLAELDAAAAA